MRKRVCALLVLLLLLAAMTLPVSAAGTANITVKGSGDYMVGDTVSVDFVIANNPGFTYAKFSLLYSTGVLKLNKVTQGIMKDGAVDSANGVVIGTSISNITENGILFTASFTVIGTGSAAVTGTFSRLENSEGDSVPYTITSAVINATKAVEKTTEAPTTAEKTTAEKTTAEKTTAEKTTAEKTTAEKTTAEKTTAEKTTAESTEAEATTAEKTTAETTTAAKTTAAEKTATESAEAATTTAAKTTAAKTTEAEKSKDSGGVLFGLSVSEVVFYGFAGLLVIQGIVILCIIVSKKKK